MTVPPDFEFPPAKDEDPSAQFANMEEMYRTLSTGINGIYLSSDQPAPFFWQPVLEGQISPGTFTYTTQVGQVYRQGPLVDCWWTVEWSGMSGAVGALRLIAPYRCTETSGSIFNGTMWVGPYVWQTATSTCCRSAIEPRSFYIQFQALQNNTPPADFNVSTTGGFTGHIRYIGIANDQER